MESPLLSTLFADGQRGPSSVSELNAEIKTTLERAFSYIWVEGEITGFHAAASGHWYFSLTDGTSTIKAVCFKGQNFRIRFKPSDGLTVRVRGRVTTYEARGEYQIIVESLEPVGEGALAVAFEQIKSRLAAEGLFDLEKKRPLPQFPKRVGLITSPKGAALHDILTIMDRRARSIDILLVPTLVQGERAGEQIAAAIENANEYNRRSGEERRIDVLIVGRGGGSAEDLWAFNEERVARAIRGSEIPVISAVGHEVDITIADLAADLRAPTPSAAAELVAKAEVDIVNYVTQLSARMIRSSEILLLSARTELQSLAMAPVFVEFPARIRRLDYGVEQMMASAFNVARTRLRSAAGAAGEVAARLSPTELSHRLGQTVRRLALVEQKMSVAAMSVVRAREHSVDNSMARLDSMSPLRVLDRGYSITQLNDGRILRDASEASVGSSLSIRLARGSIEAETRVIKGEG